MNIDSEVVYYRSGGHAIFYGPGGHTTQMMPEANARAVAAALGVAFRVFGN